MKALQIWQIGTTAMPIDRAIFIDSWALLALANRKDNNHPEAAAGYREIMNRGISMVTSD